MSARTGKSSGVAVAGYLSLHASDVTVAEFSASSFDMASADSRQGGFELVSTTGLQTLSNLVFAGQQASSMATGSLSAPSSSHYHSADDADEQKNAADAEKKILMEHDANSTSVHSETVEIASAVSSLGLIWMTGRQAILAASLLTSAPAWQRIDPLPLLDEHDINHDEEGDGSSIDIADHLFSNIKSSSKEKV